MSNPNLAPADLQADETVARATNETNEGNTAPEEVNPEMETPLGEQIDAGNDEFMQEETEQMQDDLNQDLEGDTHQETGGEA